MAPETKGDISMEEPMKQTSYDRLEGVRDKQDTTSDRCRTFGGFTSFLIADILKPEFSCGTKGVTSNTAGISSTVRTSTTAHAVTTIKHDVDYTTPAPPIDLTCKKRRRRDDSESDCSESSSSSTSSSSSACMPGKSEGAPGEFMWPAWVYCTRYSDRPSAGPRSRKTRREKKTSDSKRLRTAFSSEQLARLQAAFDSNRYLNESDRHSLATQLALNESQIKIWFQNKRAKLKKASGRQNELALKLTAEGLYNHANPSAR